MNIHTYRNSLESSASQWETDDLIYVANDYTAYWPQKAVKEARNELNIRKISSEYENEVLADKAKEEQFYIRLESKEEEKRNSNIYENYKLCEVLIILLLSPFILLGKFSYGLSVSELKTENYRLKSRKRVLLLISSAILWLALCFWGSYVRF